MAAWPPALMVQGTTSDAGKSALVTALCRYLQRQGVKVAPFKPQNMALNSAVTADGGEIGRAQAVQAAACGLPPLNDMNPVLLKPHRDSDAQVIVQGKMLGRLSAQEFHAYKPQAMQAVLESWRRLTAVYETVIVEGAGSPAEINLREGDIANMGFAEAVDCPVILIADIDRGGVFAHIVGTLELLSASEQRRVIGFVINKFRGDIALLQPGVDWLARRTGKPVLAVLPFLPDLFLEAEDALIQRPMAADRPFRVVTPVLPGFSNHTDFDPLQLHPQVTVRFARAAEELRGADLLVLPGSKTVARDLAYLREHGFEPEIVRHLRYGGKLLGVCGGFQMLGQAVLDPDGMESEQVFSKGLGLLEMETVMRREKITRQNAGKFNWGTAKVAGYEIHKGHSYGPALRRPMFVLRQGPDGAMSADGQIAGAYLHGMFDLPEACDAILDWAGLRDGAAVDMQARREAGFEVLADALERHFDFAALQRAWREFAAGR